MLRLLPTKHHAALPLPDPLTVQLQEEDQDHRRGRDAGLDAEGARRAQLQHPRYLDVRGHEAGPVAARGDPGADFAGALGVAVEQVGVDGRGDDHDADALHAGEDGEHHVVPQVLQPQPDDDEGDGKEYRGWVGDDEARLRVDATAVAASVPVCEAVVEPMSGEPADQNTCV